MTSFKSAVESAVMPLVSFVGILGNVFSFYILRQKDVKLRYKQQP